MNRRCKTAIHRSGVLLCAILAASCGSSPDWPRTPSFKIAELAPGACKPVGCWLHKDIEAVKSKSGAGAFVFLRNDPNSIDFMVKLGRRDPLSRPGGIVSRQPADKAQRWTRAFLERPDGGLVELDTYYDSDDTTSMAVQIPANYTADHATADVRLLLRGGRICRYRLNLPPFAPAPSGPVKPTATVDGMKLSAIAGVAPAGPNGESPFTAAILTIEAPAQKEAVVSVTDWTFAIPEWKLRAQIGSGRVRPAALDGQPAKVGVAFSDYWSRDPEAVTITGKVRRERVFDEIVDFGTVPVEKQKYRAGQENDAYTLVTPSVTARTPSGLPVTLKPAHILDRTVTDSRTIRSRFVARVVIDVGVGTGLPGYDPKLGPAAIEFDWPDAIERRGFLRPDFSALGEAVIGANLSLPPSAASAHVRLLVRRRMPIAENPFELRVPVSRIPRDALGFDASRWSGVFRFDATKAKVGL